MGRFRKFMPYTSHGDSSSPGWRSRASHRSAGFWSKDEILTKAFFDHDYGVWALGCRRRAAHRLLHDAPGVPGLLRQRPASGRRRRPRPYRSCRAAPTTFSSTTPIPPPGRTTSTSRAANRPSRSANRRASASSATTRRTSPHRDDRPARSSSRRSRSIGGILTIPLKGIEFLVDWLEPVFHDVPAIETPSFVDGLLLSAVSVTVGLIGIALAIRALPARDRRARSGSRSRARSGRSVRVFGHAYYFDEGVARLVDGPLRRFSQWLSERLRRRDHRRRGQRRRVVWSPRWRDGLRRVQTGLVRNYALWIVVGAAGLLLFLVIWAGR